MSCREIRDRLMQAGAADSWAQRHLAECAACRAFATRLELARANLKRHHAGVEPDAAFAARVAERVSGDSAELLGWAATRLLPVTLALLLVLAYFALGSPAETQAQAAPPPTDDLLLWVVEQGAES